MSVTLNKSRYCEIYIWLGRNDDGVPSTAAGGGKVSKNDDSARCGHAALGIVDGKKTVYVSLWPGKKGSSFVDSLEHDNVNEGGPPDTIIRLHNLNIPDMLTALGKVEKKAKEGKVKWVAKASSKDKYDITQSKSTEANCATCVYFILKAGGLNDPSSKYSKHTSGKGPKDRTFYEKTKCNVADIFFGIFNGSIFTKSYFTPKGLLLRVASAAEAYSEDKATTSKIMSSDRVTQDVDAKSVKNKVKQFVKKTKAA